MEGKITVDWVPRSRRLPTADDADVWGCVLVWHSYNGAMITGWFQLGINPLLTHWAKTPDEP